MAFLPPFKRTECACTACVAFCNRPAHLIPGDIFAITDALMADGRIQTKQEVFNFLQASKGAVVGEQATGKRYRIGTITPKTVDGKCIFLTKDNRCSIHAVSPFGCAFFDDHMSQLEGTARSMWGLRQIAQTPGYEQLRQKLIADAGVTEPFTPTQEDQGGQSKNENKH